LPLARQQMVEIARAIAQRARILAMDEPTATLTGEEVATLFGIMRQLTADGVAVIFVSHRLEEVFEIADSIAVLRDGQLVGTLARQEATSERVIELMVGRPIDRQFPKQVAAPGPPAIEVEHLFTKQLLRDVSLTVRQGEVVGLAGLVGAGRTELARTIFGLDRISAGHIRVNQQPVSIQSPADAIRVGIGYVPEDRKRSGLLLGFPLYRNHTLPSLSRYVRSGRIVRSLEVNAFQHWATELGIQAHGADEEARYLSGGNQQKVSLAKWLELSPRVLILDEPTRGIDVGAKVEIYEIINRLAKGGTAILMISSDLPEVLGMSDRIVVMHEGRVTGEFARGSVTREQVMEAAIA
jgi:ABC-type sugar transport system ATPase subunit